MIRTTLVALLLLVSAAAQSQNSGDRENLLGELLTYAIELGEVHTKIHKRIEDLHPGDQFVLTLHGKITETMLTPAGAGLNVVGWKYTVRYPSINPQCFEFPLTEEEVARCACMRTREERTYTGIEADLFVLYKVEGEKKPVVLNPTET